MAALHLPDVPDDDRRRLTSQLADLARAEPAVFAAVVRRSDELQRTGVARDASLATALDELAHDSKARNGRLTQR